MPNPKDTKVLPCGCVHRPSTPEEQTKTVEALKSLMAKITVAPEGQAPRHEHGGHYPGCHKIHLECANKKIEEAKNIINSVYISERDLTQIELKWLESLGEK